MKAAKPKLNLNEVNRAQVDYMAAQMGVKRAPGESDRHFGWRVSQKMLANFEAVQALHPRQKDETNPDRRGTGREHLDATR